MHADQSTMKITVFFRKDRNVQNGIVNKRKNQIKINIQRTIFYILLHTYSSGMFYV